MIILTISKEYELWSVIIKDIPFPTLPLPCFYSNMIFNKLVKQYVIQRCSLGSLMLSQKLRTHLSQVMFISIICTSGKDLAMLLSHCAEQLHEFAKMYSAVLAFLGKCIGTLYIGNKYWKVNDLSKCNMSQS